MCYRTMPLPLPPKSQHKSWIFPDPTPVIVMRSSRLLLPEAMLPSLARRGDHAKLLHHRHLVK